MTLQMIGKPVARVDGRAKVTGAARYAAEFNQPNQAYAIVVGSRIGLGRVTEIDASAVMRLPGVTGVVSHLNGLAASLGVKPGQSCRDAATRLQQALRTDREPPDAREAAFLLMSETPQVWALDSASLVLTEHKNAIVVTGSHGGLLGGKPDTALKYDVLGALYNDAGIGKDEAGISRLPSLDARGIPAATVSAASARIGDARSTYEDGIVSLINKRAEALGLREGISSSEFVTALRRALAR